MLTYNAIGTYVLVLTLAAVFAIAVIVQQERSGKGIGLWLAGLIGLLVGAGGAAAAVQYLGYDLVKATPTGYITRDPSAGPDPTLGATSPPGGGAPGGGGPGAGSPGGGGGFGGGGFGGGPSPKAQLTTLVRKIDLLTGDIALTLTSEQSASVAELLQRIAAQEAMTNEQATALREELLALLTDEQKAKQDAIGIPFRRGGGSGGPGGPGGGSPGGGEEANPFQDGENANAIKSLLGRLGSESATESAPASATEQ